MAKNATAEYNVLVEYAANICNSDRVAKVFGKERSNELSDILGEFVREWEECPCDPDGATPEQDERMDAVLDNYRDKINAL